LLTSAPYWPNGWGKTTLLDIITGRPESGRIAKIAYIPSFVLKPA
jgi:hypothetical protein